VISVPVLASLLERHWGMADIQAAVLGGGMGSATWSVTDGVDRWVAKLVAPVAGRQFAGGLSIARGLQEAGIRAGAPVSAADGQVAVDVGLGWLALLRWVPGHPLSGRSPSDRALMGATLARVHRALAGLSSDGAQQFHWVDPAADYLSLRTWLRPAITAAIDVLDAADPDGMTAGLLHADPAPDAFRLDPETGVCGVIDWSYFVTGPLLYDLASAVMHVGGLPHSGELMQAYLRFGLLDRAEVQHGLEPMLRFRWAVQANYFAWRIAAHDLTGISGPQENEKHLEEARRALAM